MTNTLSTPSCLRRRVGSTLLALGIAVGALAATATPAEAAVFVARCFQRPSIDPLSYTVRVDLRVWNPYKQVWQPTGVSQWIAVSPTAACVTFLVPAAYQNFITAMVVDHTITKNQTTVRYFGWNGQTAPEGNVVSLNYQPAVVKFNVQSSSDGLGVNTSYWH